MKKAIAVVAVAMFACVAFAAAPKDLEGATLLTTEVATDTTGNTLAKDTGVPVKIVVTTDTSFAAGNPKKSPKPQVVEFKGEKALKIRCNYDNEIRCAFVFDKTISAKGYKHLHFKIAGPFTGDGGAYNVGLLYTDTKENGERIGSFYSSHICPEDWTTVDIDLTKDELWSNNFNDARSIYCLQFWCSAQRFIYVKDLSLTK